MSQINKWFLLNDLDINSNDTVVLNENIATGLGFCEIAEDSVKLLTDITTVSGIYVDIWDSLIATVASELYVKQGKNGLKKLKIMGESGSMPSDYSASVVNMINRFKQLYIIPPS